MHMNGNKGNFGFDDGLHGLFFVVEREPLSSGLLTEAQIDEAYSRLNASLQATSLEMKAYLKTRSSLILTPPTSVCR